MKLIGIIGGVASGKSLVASQLKSLGAVVLDADLAGHKVLKMPEVKESLAKRWGDMILGPDGEIVRSRVAAIVFGEDENAADQLEFLEAETHPRIREILAKEIKQLRADGQLKAAILDAPVMMKAGWDKLCDMIVYVDASADLRLKRAQTRGWSRDEFDAREGAQESLDVKFSRADLVIDNSGSAEDTMNQVRQLWHALEQTVESSSPRE